MYLSSSDLPPLGDCPVKGFSSLHELDKSPTTSSASMMFALLARNKK